MELAFFAKPKEQEHILGEMSEKLQFSIFWQATVDGRYEEIANCSQIEQISKKNAPRSTILMLSDITDAHSIRERQVGEALQSNLKGRTCHFSYGRESDGILESAAITGGSGEFSKKLRIHLRRVLLNLGGFGTIYTYRNGNAETIIRNYYWTRLAVESGLKWVQFLSAGLTTENVKAWMVSANRLD